MANLPAGFVLARPEESVRLNSRQSAPSIASSRIQEASLTGLRRMRQGSTGFVYRDRPVARLQRNLRPTPATVLALKVRIPGFSGRPFQRVRFKFRINISRVTIGQNLKTRGLRQS